LLAGFAAGAQSNLNSLKDTEIIKIYGSNVFNFSDDIRYLREYSFLITNTIEVWPTHWESYSPPLTDEEVTRGYFLAIGHARIVPDPNPTSKDIITQVCEVHRLDFTWREKQWYELDTNVVSSVTNHFELSTEWKQK
jgi:hypothetical protein